MDDIVITDLSDSILKVLRNRGLSEKSICEIERYGMRPILAEFRANGRAVYSRDVVRELVWREWEKVKENILPRDRWRHLRRAAVYFEQMASSGNIQETPLPKWEVENNPLFQSANVDPEKANDINTLVLLTRDEV